MGVAELVPAREVINIVQIIPNFFALVHVLIIMNVLY